MLSIASFMQENLYNTKDGYYIKQDPLGAQNDFITAPEISQLFGEMIGVFCYDAWIKLGSPRDFNLIELGPGTGKLMWDILRATRNCPNFSNAFNIKLVEVNEKLTLLQQELLKNYPVAWLKNIFELDFKKASIIIANEFFDCLPINQYIKQDKTWYEHYIQQQRLTKLPIESSLSNKFNLEHPNCQNILEISYQAQNIIDYISNKMEYGYFLAIDYGYDINPVNRTEYVDTLQAIKNHQYYDFLKANKNVDLTAHVDFFALKAIAQANKQQVLGTITQAKFLENLGIHLRSSLLKKQISQKHISADEKKAQAEILDQQLYYLLDPKKMGEIFRVLSIFSKNLSPPIGFEQ